ncbi:restriction endonuclease subunit S [Micromonospora sp. NPDC049374]|uniref:restriction endonuclease subunit S n=1 Tax=Micromonospora sp. NPDC049374 TaxID=3154352 RepID=UPI00344A70C5
MKNDSFRPTALRHLITCLDGRRVPLNSEQRAEMPGPVPYWGANGVVDHVSRHLFDEALVLLGEDGAPFFEAGRDVAFLVNEPVWVNNHIHVLRPRGVDPRFLTYALNAVDYSRYITGSTRDKLTQDDLRRIELNIPDLQEQRRIADFLDAETSRVDALRRTMGRLRSLLIERRNSVVHGYVTGLNHGAERVQGLLHWATSLPACWPAVRLNLLAVMGSGHTPSRSHEEWWVDCSIPWITTGEVSQVRDDRREVIDQTRERISIVGMANSSARLHPAGTVVLCRTASAGYSAVMGADMATSQDFVTWTCGPRLDPYYLLWCLRAMRSDLLGRLAMGSTHKTIYLPDLQMLRVPVPPIQEQRRIVERIRQSNARIDAAVDAIDRQMALLAERRSALVIAAVAGRLDVTAKRGEEG